MTRDEIEALLTFAGTYDSREVGEAMVTAWLAAAVHAQWTNDEAIDAVIAHYAANNDWIRPGHITQTIRGSRRRFWQE
ncbi:hypothetical protein SAMN04244553_3614 [Nocardia amikacinitolerans]|uniref:Uncharacterized protein n=1 Tax=Nocardia amikacinitolerans TaxID=756689 RepID=A0A285LH59_9NOCA|nr:hypothetical protein [Nocardia amikacinitolerans]SNY84289.1 hypothetical protein SAMN04244553_3614 [Nocardia amikacinitolerans]